MIRVARAASLAARDASGVDAPGVTSNSPLAGGIWLGLIA